MTLKNSDIYNVIDAALLLKWRTAVHVMLYNKCWEGHVLLARWFQSQVATSCMPTYQL